MAPSDGRAVGELALGVERMLSPNHDPRPIEVEFLLLHYTAADLETTLSLFSDPRSEVSAHLVVDRDGRVVETVPCLDGQACRAWHAGRSRWDDGERRWERFNDLAVGVELVNPNGNVVPYTEAQYEALERVVRRLQRLYPALAAPERILGHEQVAGWRGKADPGALFEWGRLFAACCPGRPAPERSCACPDRLRAELESLAALAPAEGVAKARFWMAVSSLTETCVDLVNGARAEAAGDAAEGATRDGGEPCRG